MLTSLITLSLDYILTGSNNCYMFTLPMICLRFYMSPSDKQKVYDKIPSWFDEVVCGVMLGDGTIRMNGKLALLGIQQTHEELVETLWAMCSSLNLVYAPILEINRSNWKTVYSFQTLTLPYFTELSAVWYTSIDGKRFKILPDSINTLLSPRALAYWLMADGSWDKSTGRLLLHSNWFTLQEVETLQSILFENYQITSYLQHSANSEPNRGYTIRIPRREVHKVQRLSLQYMCPSLYYKLGR